MATETIAINYIEFNVKNIAKSKAFYSALGWGFDAMILCVTVQLCDGLLQQL